MPWRSDADLILLWNLQNTMELRTPASEIAAPKAPRPDLDAKAEERRFWSTFKRNSRKKSSIPKSKTNLLQNLKFRPSTIPTNGLTHRPCYTQTPWHTDVCTYRHFYTQTLVHTTAFTHRVLYTQMLLHANTFSHNRFYTQPLLYTNAFTHSRFYWQTLSCTHRQF